MTRQSMVERVADHIEARMLLILQEERCLTPRELAEVAIVAMREPTPEMIAETLPSTAEQYDDETVRLAERACFLLEGKAIFPESQFAGRIAAREVIRDWRAMIDAALTQPSGDER